MGGGKRERGEGVKVEVYMGRRQGERGGGGEREREPV